MKMFLAIVLVVLVSLLIWISAGHEDAMKECERAYSHDVCFQILNN